jgi:hypothetical protein
MTGYRRFHAGVRWPRHSAEFGRAGLIRRSWKTRAKRGVPEARSRPPGTRSGRDSAPRQECPSPARSPQGVARPREKRTSRPPRPASHQGHLAQPADLFEPGRAEPPGAVQGGEKNKRVAPGKLFRQGRVDLPGRPPGPCPMTATASPGTRSGPRLARSASATAAASRVAHKRPAHGHRREGPAFYRAGRPSQDLGEFPDGHTCNDCTATRAN